MSLGFDSSPMQLKMASNVWMSFLAFCFIGIIVYDFFFNHDEICVKNG